MWSSEVWPILVFRGWVLFRLCDLLMGSFFLVTPRWLWGPEKVCVFPIRRAHAGLSQDLSSDASCGTNATKTT